MIAPDDPIIDLTKSEQVVMECLATADGAAVTRDALRRRLGQGSDGDDEVSDSLNATIYRLRRRIERAAPLVVPLQSKSRRLPPPHGWATNGMLEDKQRRRLVLGITSTETLDELT